MSESKEEWCERTFRYVDEEHGPIVRWVLSGRGSSFGKFSQFAKLERPATANGLFAAIEREVTNSGVSEARVRAYQKGAKDQVSQRRWEVYMSLDDAGVGESGDMAVQLVSQAIRHAESYHHSSQAGAQNTIRFLVGELEKARAENVELRKAWVDAFQLIQELEDRKLERVMKAEGALTMNQGIRAAVGAVQHKLLGKPATEAERKESKKEAFKLFYESLSEEQVEQVRAALRPDQQMSMAMLFSEDSAEAEEPAGEDDDGDEDELEDDEDELEDEDEDEPTPPMGPQALKMLKAVLSPRAYAAALTLLRDERSLIDNPGLLISMAKEAVASADDSAEGSPANAE